MHLENSGFTTNSTLIYRLEKRLQSITTLVVISNYNQSDSCVNRIKIRLSQVE